MNIKLSEIARVDFYRGSTLIGTVSSAPYTVLWNNAPAGTYSLTAKATDDKGASTTSAARTIKVESSVVAREIYYIHADHLNTPRLITNKQNQAVWRNGPLTEPFGTSTPEEDPRNTGTRFEFNLRFPGQYYDKETATHYNYYRDYNPQTGRYLQSDPIGLQGGINTYGYVGGNPVEEVDPLGLWKMCHRKMLVPAPYARHCYMRFGDGSTSSYDTDGVHPDPAPNQEAVCTAQYDTTKDDCIKKAMQNCQGDKYDFTGFNCCHCAEQAMKECGVSVPKASWPNWPVNPGPQPGETGYSPSPVYNSTLGK